MHQLNSDVDIEEAIDDFTKHPSNIKNKKEQELQHYLHLSHSQLKTLDGEERIFRGITCGWHQS